MSAPDISTSATASLGANQINAVSGASGYVPTATTTTDPVIDQMRNDIKETSQDFKGLKHALNSNDLGSATQAFTALQQNIQTASQAAGGKSPFSSSPIGQDFQALGDALKTGNLSAAKEAFGAFKRDIKTAGRAACAQPLPPENGGNEVGSGQSSPMIATSSVPVSATIGGILNTTA
jgi:hypothetical protein